MIGFPQHADLFLTSTPRAFGGLDVDFPLPALEMLLHFSSLCTSRKPFAVCRGICFLFSAATLGIHHIGHPDSYIISSSFTICLLYLLVRSLG